MSSHLPVTPAPDDPERDFEQLKLLYDYTKFHIGLYITVATIFGATIAAKGGPFEFNVRLLQSSVVFICIAGAAGGVIASSIPQFQSHAAFWKAKLSVLLFVRFTAAMWAHIEHAAFWLAIILAVFAVIPRAAV